MKQKLITLSSPIAVRDTKSKVTYLVNVVEGYITTISSSERLLRIHKVYDAASKGMTTLGETITIEAKASNIRSTQEL